MAPDSGKAHKKNCSVLRQDREERDYTTQALLALLNIAYGEGPQSYDESSKAVRQESDAIKYTKGDDRSRNAPQYRTVLTQLRERLQADNKRGSETLAFLFKQAQIQTKATAELEKQKKRIDALEAKLKEVSSRVKVKRKGTKGATSPYTRFVGGISKAERDAIQDGMREVCRDSKCDRASDTIVIGGVDSGVTFLKVIKAYRKHKGNPDLDPRDSFTALAALWHISKSNKQMKKAIEKLLGTLQSNKPAKSDDVEKESSEEEDDSSDLDG